MVIKYEDWVKENKHRFAWNYFRIRDRRKGKAFNRKRKDPAEVWLLAKQAASRWNKLIANGTIIQTGDREYRLKI